ncbi:MAG: hypothetical protein P8R42_10710 [Candidatus Binatia bacterium]|nr:hypothetical protein [Candidatus Binatia bacterium]
MRSGPVLVCAALPYECGPLAKLLTTPRRVRDDAGRSRWSGRVADVDIVVQETGMGLAAAAATARAAIDAVSPRCLVSTGLAGGLSPAVALGDVIVPDHVARSGSSPLSVDPELRAIAAADLPQGRSRRGLLVSVERVVRTPTEKSALRTSTRADAVDMESAAILEVALPMSVPAIVVRAASDTAQDELPDLSGLDLSRVADQARLAARALTSPRLAQRIARLGWGGHRATRTLTKVLGNLLPRLHS